MSRPTSRQQLKWVEEALLGLESGLSVAALAVPKQSQIRVSGGTLGWIVVSLEFIRCALPTAPCQP